MPDSPLKHQWLSLCAAIGLEGEEQWQKLHAGYTTSGLAYHNLDHIADCLQKFSARKQEADDPHAVELAIWFHDLIYDPRAKDNEEQSARKAREFLVGTSYEDKVTNLILVTQHTDEPDSNDEKLLCDIDLSILGSPESQYLRYAQAIREEYSWVPEKDYCIGRTKVLQGFLDRPSIFALESSRALHEEPARLNLQNEIARLAD